MVNDTLIGVLGAVLIVGSMTAVIQGLSSDEGPGESDQVEGPPPAMGDSTFAANDCRAFTATWAPDQSALEPVVGPHWSPSPGPAPGTGTFSLFVYECPETSVDGLRRGGTTGAAALVAIEVPEETRNVSAPGGWLAVPEYIGALEGASTQALERHKFNITHGSGSIGVIETPVGNQVRAVLSTPDGSVEITSLIAEQASERRVEGALVGTSEAWFSVFTGPEEMQRRTAGQATVQTTGTTWIDRLGLAPVPVEVAYDTGLSWEFEVFHEPWNPDTDATTNVTLG